jgi:hypothetical protein
VPVNIIQRHLGHPRRECIQETGYPEGQPPRNRALARRASGRVDNRRMDYMRSLFGAFCPDEDDVEARCMVFYTLWIGSHFIAADHGAQPRGRAEARPGAARGLVPHRERRAPIPAPAEEQDSRRISPAPSPCKKQGARPAGIDRNRRRDGAALRALAFAQMRAPESRSAACLLRTTPESAA